MTANFAILAVEDLHEHEQTDRRRVQAVAQAIRRTGIVDFPILVDRRSGVILDGHHRFQALVGLGARRVPAWLVDYEADYVRLGRWGEGPPIAKAEVVERARAGKLYPPKTTRHSLELSLPPRATALEALLSPTAPADAGAPAQAPARSRSPARASGR